MSTPLLLDDYLHIAHRIDRRMAQTFCPRLPGRVLDVGCGRRPYRHFLTAATDYVGMELDDRLEPDVVGSVLDIPFATASFDAVMCNEVLEHVPDPARAVEELHRVLRPNGLAYVTVPQSWGLHYEPHDYFRYTRYGVARLLEGAGFEVLEVRQMGALFSYFTVRLIDLFVARLLFPLCDRIRLHRGRYRLAALMALPITVIVGPVAAALDRLDPINAYGWAVLARRS